MGNTVKAGSRIFLLLACANRKIFAAGQIENALARVLHC